jgi:hypothetical protein
MTAPSKLEWSPTASKNHSELLAKPEVNSDLIRLTMVMESKKKNLLQEPERGATAGTAWDIIPETPVMSEEGFSTEEECQSWSSSTGVPANLVRTIHSYLQTTIRTLGLSTINYL